VIVTNSFETKLCWDKVFNVAQDRIEIGAKIASCTAMC